MKMFSPTLWLFAVTATLSAAEKTVTRSKLVQIDQGPVRGYNEDGLFAFHAIPYASAPMLTERFKAPRPPRTWTEPFEAVTSRFICSQSAVIHGINVFMSMGEDCLVVNVYVPDTEETNLSVVVYVHGGSYQQGFGNLMTPRNLVRTKRAIAVTFNYRLGPHGFLCLGTEYAPGNAGSKDQVALLRWVQRNIASFGGNPNDVTIAGYGAGGSSVDLLMISPMARGLFNKVIVESGASVGILTVQNDPVENAAMIARQMNFFNVHDRYALENFYTTLDLWRLYSVNVLSRPDSSFVFTPCVERDLGEERFLDTNPVDILRSGNYPKVPMLYGFAEMEGIFRVPEFSSWNSNMNEKFSDYLPADLWFTNEQEMDFVASLAKLVYFGYNDVGPATILGYVDYFTDIMFAYPILRAVKMQVEAGNDRIYLYQYSFVDENEDFIPFTNVRGAAHTAQTYAIMDGNSTQTDETIISEEHRQMKSVMRELWLNFITTGEPVPPGSPLPSWPPVQDSRTRSPHMNLDRTLELRGPLLQERTEFWDVIYSSFYRYPVPPTEPPIRPIEDIKRH